MKLEVRNLKKTYGTVQALKGINYTFTPGVYGILGANGAGKSTMINLITDNVSRDKMNGGSILFGEDSAEEDILKLGKQFRGLVGYNRRNTDKTSLGHAEITAIKKASRYMNDWRLENCTLYVTLEPCQMCAGAIVQARIPRVVIGSMNPKAGCAGSILNILQIPTFNHQCEITKGVCEEECSEMLTTFFKELRKSKKKNTAVTTDGE